MATQLQPDPLLMDRLMRCLTAFSARNVEDLTDVYEYFPDFRRAKLGSGSYGETYTVRLKAQPAEPVRAVKIIPKVRITRTPLQVQHICAELAVTLKLASEHLNHAVDLLQSPTHVFLVLEMCRGPIPDIRTRLYHLFARYHPARIPEVESLAQQFEREFGSAFAPGTTSTADTDNFFDGKMAQILAQLGVKAEAPTRTDLFNLIVHHKRIPEMKAAIILKQCLQGVAFMHQNQVVHRDIKTENVILGETRTSEPVRDENGAVVGVRISERISVKLIDFGLVKYMRLATFPLSPSPGTFERAVDAFAAPDTGKPEYSAPTTFDVQVTPCGTELYCALEVLTGILNNDAGNSKWQSCSDTLPKLDVYGCGTMLFCMANGRAPFRLQNTSYRPISRAEKLRQIQQLISAGPLCGSTVSDRQRSFIQLLMHNDYRLRPTAEEALRHPYFEGIGATYTYEVRSDGQVSFVSGSDEEEVAAYLHDDGLNEIMREKEDAGDGVGKEGDSQP